MRYGELFAGAGGMSLGLERAGLSCAFHAELADFLGGIKRHVERTVAQLPSHQAYVEQYCRAN